MDLMQVVVCSVHMSLSLFTMPSLYILYILNICTSNLHFETNQLALSQTIIYYLLYTTASAAQLALSITLTNSIPASLVDMGNICSTESHGRYQTCADAAYNAGTPAQRADCEWVKDTLFNCVVKAYGPSTAAAAAKYCETIPKCITKREADAVKVMNIEIYCIFQGGVGLTECVACRGRKPARQQRYVE